MQAQYRSMQYFESHNLRYKISKGDLFQFQFPPQQLRCKHLSTFQQLFTEIDRLAIALKLCQSPKDLFYTKCLSKQQARWKCKSCPAFASWKLVGCQVQCQILSNEHRHSMKKEKWISRQYLRQIKLSKRQRYDQLQKINNVSEQDEVKHPFNRKTTFPQMMKFFPEDKYEVRYYQNGEEYFPAMFLVLSREMIQLYQKYGEVVCFDLTYNLVDKKSKRGHSWGLGNFVGIGQNHEILVFGFCLMCTQTKQAFKTLFSDFLSIVGSSPNAFITDQQQTMRLALHDLKQQGIFTGNHLLDMFHMLRNLRGRAKKQNIHIYRSMMKSKSTTQFQHLLKSLKATDQDPRIIDKFLQYSHMYCFSQVPCDRFIGMSCSNSRSEKFNDSIKDRLPHETYPVRVVMVMDAMIQRKVNTRRYYEFQTRRFEKLFADEGVGRVRGVVYKAVFRQFMMGYMRACKYSLGVQVNDQNKVYTVRTKSYEQEVVRDRDGRLSCECGCTVKSGLPCQHILKIMIYQHETNYVDYINKRWITEGDHPVVMPNKPNLQEIKVMGFSLNRVQWKIKENDWFKELINSVRNND